MNENDSGCVTWLDYSSGGVPVGQSFKMVLTDLREIIDSSSEESGINRLNEICLFGLTSYFEAFCKDQFATLINIVPDLIRNLKKSGQDVFIDASHIVLYGV